MKGQSFRASRERGGGWRTKFKQGFRVENGTTNLLIISLNYERSKFPRFTRRGRRTEFRQRIRVKNGTTNLLLSLIINERSKLPRFARKGGGGRTKFKQGFRVENGTTNLLILSLIISLNYERSKFDLVSIDMLSFKKRSAQFSNFQPPLLENPGSAPVSVSFGQIILTFTTYLMTRHVEARGSNLEISLNQFLSVYKTM